MLLHSTVALDFKDSFPKTVVAENHEKGFSNLIYKYWFHKIHLLQLT